METATQNTKVILLKTNLTFSIVFIKTNHI